MRASTDILMARCAKTPSMVCYGGNRILCVPPAYSDLPRSTPVRIAPWGDRAATRGGTRCASIKPAIFPRQSRFHPMIQTILYREDCPPLAGSLGRTMATCSACYVPKSATA